MERNSRDKRHLVPAHDCCWTALSVWLRAEATPTHSTCSDVASGDGCTSDCRFLAVVFGSNPLMLASCLLCRRLHVLPSGSESTYLRGLLFHILTIKTKKSDRIGIDCSPGPARVSGTRREISDGRCGACTSRPCTAGSALRRVPGRSAAARLRSSPLGSRCPQSLLLLPACRG